MFGLLKRGGRACAVRYLDANSSTLLGIDREHLRPDSFNYTASSRSHGVLKVLEFHQLRIDHAERFVDRANHIDNIENWRQAKRHFRCTNGIVRQHFRLLLEEGKWRFDHQPTGNLSRVLLRWSDLGRQ